MIDRESKGEDEGVQLQKRPVKFRYQRSPEYQRFVEKGIVKDLGSSGFCWLASVEMAASRYLYDDTERLKWIEGVAVSAKEAGFLSEEGSFIPAEDESEVAFLNEQFTRGGIPIEVSAIDIRDSDGLDLFDLPLRGSMLLVGIGVPENDDGHMMLLDKAFITPDQSDVAISLLNPAVPAIDMPFAREFLHFEQPNMFIQGLPAQFGPIAYVLSEREPTLQTPPDSSPSV